MIEQIKSVFGIKTKLSEADMKVEKIFRNISPTLRMHSMNVAVYAERLLQHMLQEAGNKDLELQNIGKDKRLYVAALFHDIGKLKIPKEILSKTGQLTPKEMDVVKKHTIYGGMLASRQSALWSEYKNEMIKIACCHHERWDGKGYPYGLKGTQIPVSARICAIADAYDVMVSGRMYQKWITHEQACAEIRENAGTQFDPAIAELFVRNHFVFEKERE